MSIIYPSNLNNHFKDGVQSFGGSSLTQTYGFLSLAQPNDIIIFSSVGLYPNIEQNFQGLYDLILDKVKSGVILLIGIPQIWCMDDDDGGYYPLGCGSQGALSINDDGKQYLEELLSYDNCIPLYTTDKFAVHLKCCDWISTDNTNPQAAIYFGSSNFYTSWHEELGMYVTGDYNQDDLILQAVVSRLNYVEQWSKGWPHWMAFNIPIESLSQNKQNYYNTAINYMRQLGQAVITEDYVKKLNGGIYFPVNDVKFQLDDSETVYCYNDSMENMVYNTMAISDTDINHEPVQVTGGFRIGVTPPPPYFYGAFAYNFDLITYLFNNAKKYIKISVMDLYINDAFWTGTDGNGAPALTDQTSLALVGLLQNAVKRGIHILILTNIKVNWDPDGDHSFTNFSYSYLMNSLSGNGTVQIRFRTFGDSQQHNKCYISDQDVIISSQHPSSVSGGGFMTIYGSSIMFNDITIRNYYDNYFNSLWSVSSINLSDGSIQTPVYNTYPIIQTPDMDGDILSDNWFERKGNLLHCSTDDAPFSGCCGGLSTNNLENKVLYEVIFSDPNLLNPLDGKHNNLFYGWWYNQIENCPDNGWIYIVSAPICDLGSTSAYSKIGNGTGDGDYGDGIKAKADQQLNMSFNKIYKKALERGITFYICGWLFQLPSWDDGVYKPEFSTITNFLYDLTDGYTKYTNQVKRYNSTIFWHQKIYATPNAVYIGSQNSLLPDSYEAGFAFYSDVGSNFINPLYFEVLKVARQFVDIEKGYKPLAYNMNNPLNANWVNKVTNDVELCNSFIAVSPGNLGPYKISDNKYVTTLFGDDNVTTETEILTEIATNAKNYLLISCYDMGYTKTFSSNSPVFDGAPKAVIEAADRGVKTSVILSRQGIKERLKNMEKYGKFLTDLINHDNIDFYIQDKSCLAENNTNSYAFTRQCHHIHAKFFLSESDLYNSSSNFTPEYMESSVRNSGIYTNNTLVKSQFLDFFNWVKNNQKCIKKINTTSDLECLEEDPIVLDTNKIKVFKPYPKSDPDSPSKDDDSKTSSLIRNILIGIFCTCLIILIAYFLHKYYIKYYIKK